MPTPTSKGQFRKVRYEDDGVTIYQCLWCLNTIRISDNPDYWNFCPKCGKSWFNRLQCRDHDVPRWYYDRWGNLDGPSLWEMFPPRQQPTKRWVIEYRAKWLGEEWGDWNEDFSSGKNPYRPDYMWAYETLKLRRLDRNNDGCMEFEYRVRLKDVVNVSFVIKDGDRCESFKKFSEKYLTPRPE